MIYHQVYNIYFHAVEMLVCQLLKNAINKEKICDQQGKNNRKYNIQIATQ